jgi:hypothetical protein
LKDLAKTIALTLWLIMLTSGGCASISSPQRLAENTCTFAFLAGIPFAGPLLGPLVCSFGVDGMEEDEEDEGA